MAFMDSASQDHIFNSFTTTKKEEWLKAAQHELDGANPFQKLVFEKGGLTILPYYDEQDISTKEHFQLKPSTHEFLGARAWYNMPAIDVNGETESHQKALSELNSGADGIIFNIKTTTTDVPALLNEIAWPYCAISITGDISEQLLSRIHAHAIEKKYDVATLTGCVFRNKPFGNEFGSFKLFENWNNFHPFGIKVEKKESIAEEIATALAQAVRQFDFLTDKGFSLRQTLQGQAFYVQIDTDFFLNIAKLKVLRILWHNLAVSFDAHSDVATFIHVNSSSWIKKEYQPNGNLLKCTTAALSAILGGCDAVTIDPEEDNNTMMARVARNVSSVLREESHLSKVADPTAGSYYLETLVDQLTESAWKKFQEII